MAPALDGFAAISALATHRSAIVPRVHGELRRWSEVAASIPDPVLRGAALSALRDKQANAEATGVFAILAPREQRDRALRAMTALQTAVDYLDTLGEQPLEDSLAAGLALHRALSEAVSPGAERSDWYRAYPRSEDGGYLARLVAACQEEIAALPAIEAVRPVVQRAARRCGEAQSHTHAHAVNGGAGLRDWAERAQGPPGYLWWEVAAGASSSVAAHALIAAAADPQTSAEQAELVDAAYFPAIGAMTVLLDDLVDRAEDDASGEHNYMRYYDSDADAGGRLAFIAEQARAATARLRRRRRHDAIVAGVAGFYLSDPAAGNGFAAQADRVLESSGGTARLLRTTMRLRHRV